VQINLLGKGFSKRTGAVLGLSLLAAAVVQSGSTAQSGAYAEAVRDYSAGHYASALSKFKECEAAYPTNVLVHYYAAMCEQSLAHIEQAKQEYAWVVQHAPEGSIKANSATALSRLASVKTQIAYASPSRGFSSVAAPTTAPVARKVKRIIEFYADW
jgi:predicted Zn-dependent protease